MNRTVTILLLILSFLPMTSRGQSNDSLTATEIRFLQYLLDNSNYSDVLFGSQQLLNADWPKSPSQLDEIHFLRGLSYYQQQQCEAAAEEFFHVGTQGAIAEKAWHYGIFNTMCAKQFGQANELMFQDTLYKTSLKHLFMCGNALMQNDLKQFDSLAGKLDTLSYFIASESKDMLSYADTLRNYPKKSEALAGVMSAIVPGSGKVYSGKTGQGIAVFLELAALGLAAGEYYHKAGTESAGFILFGSLFTVFYIGNIWGSVLSVKVNKHEFENRIQNNIMVDLHLPLRRLYH